jgi:hypothetical protein
MEFTAEHRSGRNVSLVKVNELVASPLVSVNEQVVPAVINTALHGTVIDLPEVSTSNRP